MCSLPPFPSTASCLACLPAYCDVIDCRLHMNIITGTFHKYLLAPKTVPETLQLSRTFSNLVVWSVILHKWAPAGRQPASVEVTSKDTSQWLYKSQERLVTYQHQQTIRREQLYPDNQDCDLWSDIHPGNNKL
jgi:hypothetical protein